MGSRLHILLAAGCVLGCCAAGVAGDPNSCLYIPPDWEANVLAYHSFERGRDEPEVTSEGVTLRRVLGRRVAGLTGRGLVCEKRGLLFEGFDRPLTRPITASLWFRLDRPMVAESGFDLAALRGRNGYISNFVRGKGGWCALTRPTFVVQVYRWPGVTNVNGIRFGDAWLDANVWRHTAVTVSEGSRVRVYWDGRLRADVTVRGRLFGPEDVIRTVGFGGTGHPMTIDEVLVLGRSLTGAEVRAYIRAVRRLREVRIGPSSVEPAGTQAREVDDG